VGFSKGDEIAVTGSKVKQDGADLVLAREVVKGNVTLVLRDDKGNPVWTWQRKNWQAAEKLMFTTYYLSLSGVSWRRRGVVPCRRACFKPSRCLLARGLAGLGDNKDRGCGSTHGR
jgi:hypothetical protein